MAFLCRYFKVIDQRFPARREILFKRSLESHFLFPGYVGAFGSTISASMNLSQSSIDLSDPLIALRDAAIIFNIAVSATAAMVLLMRNYSAWFKSVNIELLSIVYACLLSVSYTVNSKWHLALLFGRDPHQVFGPDVVISEANMGFSIVCISTFFGMFLPLRSHLSWMVHACGLTCFGVVSFLAGSPYSKYFPRLVGILSGLAIMNWMGGFRIEQHLRERWVARCQVEKQKGLTEKQHQAFSHLLNRLCDCLVHLGSDFSILEPCPHLTAMLFHADASSLQGKCFCDYLSSAEDQARFIAVMSTGSSEEEPAGILPLHLKDSQRRDVQVHAYYTCFHDQEGSPYYVVGIVEARTRVEATELEEEPGVLRNAQKTSGQVGMQGRPGTLSEEHASENSQSESELTLEFAQGDDLGEVALTVEVEDGFKIISCTPGFTALCGPAGDGADLCDEIVDGENFRRLVQKRVEDFVSKQDLGELVLRTPTTTSARSECVNVIHKCILESISVPQDRDYPEYQQYILRLRLEDIEQTLRRRRRWELGRNGKRKRKTALQQL